MPHKPNLKRSVLMLAVPVMLLSACASGSPISSPPPAVPPLPAVARQPAIPSECLPTCLEGLIKERESWLTTPTAPESQGTRVKGRTTL